MDKTTTPETNQAKIMRNISFLVIFLSCISFAKVPANLDQSVEIVIQAFSGNKQVRCLTPYLKDIALYGNQLTEEQKSRLRNIGFQFGQPIVHRAMNDRPESEGLDQTHDNGYFRFHYTTSGTHAVAGADADGNNVPDYIDQMADVFMHVAAVQLDSFGYAEPPSDGWLPVTNDNGGSGLYDIYVRNIASNTFGYAQSEYFANNTGNNEHTTVTEENALTSLMAMRNNYTGFYSPNNQYGATSELEAIQLTAAHEYQHAIQFGYDGYEKAWLFEATATEMEEQIYDGINDCHTWLPSWFAEPHKSLDHHSEHWYGSFIFPQYIFEHFGGYLTLRRIWQNSVLNDSYYGDFSHLAISLALSDEGSSFSDAINKMVVANRILSSSTNAGVYSYEEADIFPVNGPATYQTITYNSGTDQSVTSTNLNRFASQYTRVNTTDPVLVNLTNNSGLAEDLNMHAIISYSNNSWTVYSGNSINVDPTGSSTIYLAVVSQDTSADNWDYQIDITDGELAVDNEAMPDLISISNNYPNPFNPSTSFDIQIPFKQHIRITVMSVTGKHIAEIANQTLPAGNWTFRWDGISNSGKPAPSGQYFIMIKGDNFQRWLKAILLK